MEPSAPWWEDDPTIRELTRRALAEIEEAADDANDNTTRRHDAASPDPVVDELYSGSCVRALANARDNLASARAEYETAVLNARAAGLSWGEIGQVLGLARQLLHRRFSQQR